MRTTDGDKLVFTTGRHRFERAGRREIEELLAGMEDVSEPAGLYPRADSNRCFRLRRPALYPLSYGGGPIKSSLGTA